jgi:ectoine hydroxylase-related dioxygenase (phytanoyl-CoA dioxygenase family)
MGIAALLVNDKCRRELDEQGYTVFPLLDEKSVNDLRLLYERLRKDSGVNKTFYTSIWSESAFHRKSVDEGIKAIMFPALQQHLHDIQPVFANFMVKQSAEFSDLLPHQDWSFVNEPLYDSVTAWLPLIDVSNMNGNLQVVPGSHMSSNNFIRPRFGDFPFDREKVKALLIDVPMISGEVLLLNSRLIHASPPNTSGTERIAASVVMAPRAAELKHWVASVGNIHELSVDESFFWQFSCFDNPVIGK